MTFRKPVNIRSAVPAASISEKKSKSKTKSLLLIFAAVLAFLHLRF